MDLTAEKISCLKPQTETIVCSEKSSNTFLIYKGKDKY